MNDTFQEKFAAAREKFSKKRLYNRRDTCKIIGFPGKSKDFTDWLRQNDFIDWEDSPTYSLIKKGFMDYRLKKQYFKPQYDSCNNIINDSEWQIGTVQRYFNVPLFTESGLKFFKQLLEDPELFQKETTEVKLWKVSNSIPVL